MSYVCVWYRAFFRWCYRHMSYVNMLLYIGKCIMWMVYVCDMWSWRCWICKCDELWIICDPNWVYLREETWLIVSPRVLTCRGREIWLWWCLKDGLMCYCVWMSKWIAGNISFLGSRLKSRRHITCGLELQPQIDGTEAQSWKWWGMSKLIRTFSQSL